MSGHRRYGTTLGAGQAGDQLVFLGAHRLQDALFLFSCLRRSQPHEIGHGEALCALQPAILPLGNGEPHHVGPRTRPGAVVPDLETLQRPTGQNQGDLKPQRVRTDIV